MDTEKTTSSHSDNHLENIIKCLSKCKIEFVNEREVCKKMREVNTKLEVELREVRELEKSHRYHLLTSREMIGNLQETVSQLVYLKRDVKKLKDEIILRDKTISTVEKERESLSESQKKHVAELRHAHEKDIEELKVRHETIVKQLQYESDTQIAQFTCVIEELRTKLKETETDHKEKINVVVLEYEEKNQRSEYQVTQLQEQLARETARADANIDAYRRRLEEVEEKLKQTQFKHYLAHNTYPSQYESQVERPYSVERDFAEPHFVALDSSVEVAKPKIVPSSSQNKAPRTQQNTLQVMYYGSKPNASKTTEKKGPFQITKKRKLYNEKDFINM